MKGFLPKDGSLFFMNERIHFQSCQKGVVGRCGNMHEKGVLHHIMGKVIGFFPDMAVLLVNLEVMENPESCLCTDWVMRMPGDSSERGK